MFTVVHTYSIMRGTKKKLIQHVQESLVPLLNHVPGFLAYFLVDAGENEVAIISTYDTRADAKAAARLTKEWVAEYAEPCIQGCSRVVAGQVKVQQYEQLVAKIQSHPFRRQVDWV
jgi:heme-degrading monooxygenase HmoA